MSSSLNGSTNGSTGSSPEAVTEGARRATGEMAPGRSRPGPEVFVIGRRRQFSGSEKRALLTEADRRKAAGTLGAFMREKHILRARAPKLLRRDRAFVEMTDPLG